MKKIISLLISVLLFSCNETVEPKKEAVTEQTPVTEPLKSINYTLVETLPHDTISFTEGLLIHDGKLYESSGAPDNLPQTRSFFGIVNPKTGKVEVKGELDRKQYFGEGIAILNNKLYQLTYQNKVGFIYDAKTFRNIGQFTFKNNEGWGLTTDGTYLIMSDGTSDITYLDANTQSFVKNINVNTINYDMPDQLNELEYINGFIYANVWRTNTIIKIDPATGKIVGVLDLSSLAAKAKSKYANSLEMNGIAFDSITKSIYITGKMWPEIYKIQFPI
jgi:glutamine cyclotransferase